MGVSASTPIYPPREYDKASDIPFVPDGKDPILSSFGTAMRVKTTSEHSADVKVAICKTIKMINTGQSPLKESKEEMKKKVLILSKTRHHHILKILMTYFLNSPDGVQFSIVMEHAEDSLLKYFVSKGEVRVEWFGCLIEVVSYIHQHGIRHMDIKPDNILIKNQTILLTHFDMSDMDAWTAKQTAAPKRARWKTTRYFAPEVYQGQTHGRAADIFSLGAVFLEMLYNNDPTHNLGLEFNFDSGKSYASDIDHISKWLTLIDPPQGLRQRKLFEISRKMLDPEPNSRPLAHELDNCWSSIGSTDALRCHACEMSRKGKADMTNPRAIHRAAINGQVDVVRALLGLGVDVDLKDNGQETPLFYATVSGHKDVVELLLENHANVKACNAEGWYPIHCAARGGYTDIVTILLKKGLDIESIDVEKWTPLHFAAGNGHPKTVELLLKEGAMVDALDVRGQTALHLAAKGGHAEVVDKLLSAGARVERKATGQQTALYFAAQGGHNEALRRLIVPGADVRSLIR